MNVYVCLCMNVYVCICVSVCMYVCMYTCVCMYVYVCLYVCICVYAYMCVCMCVCMYVCMYVCIYVCMYVCMYMCVVCECVVCVYIYIYICVCVCVCVCVGCVGVWPPVTWAYVGPAWGEEETGGDDGTHLLLDTERVMVGENIKRCLGPWDEGGPNLEAGPAGVSETEPMVLGDLAVAGTGDCVGTCNGEETGDGGVVWAWFPRDVDGTGEEGCGA